MQESLTHLVVYFQWWTNLCVCVSEAALILFCKILLTFLFWTKIHAPSLLSIGLETIMWRSIDNDNFSSLQVFIIYCVCTRHFTKLLRPVFLGLNIFITFIPFFSFYISILYCLLFLAISILKMLHFILVSFNVTLRNEQKMPDVI